MALSFSGQNPDIRTSGESLQPTSTPGRNVDFIRETNISSISQLMTAGSFWSLTAGSSFWDTDLPDSARTILNLKDPTQVTVWPFYNIFVDTDLDGNYFFGTGASLSTAQKNITMAQFDHITPYAGDSATTSFLFKNNDSGSHTIYFYIGDKYVITG